MKTLIDLTGLQRTSDPTNLNTPVLTFITQLVLNNKDNQWVVMADPYYQESFESLRKSFIRILPLGQYLPYHYPEPNYDSNISGIEYVTLSSSLIHQAYASVNPDIILLTDLLHSRGDKTDILPVDNIHYPKGMVLFDLKPYLGQGKKRTTGNTDISSHENVDLLHQFDFILTPSESIRQRIIHLARLSPDQVFTIFNPEKMSFNQSTQSEKIFEDKPSDQDEQKPEIDWDTYSVKVTKLLRAIMDKSTQKNIKTINRSRKSKNIEKIAYISPFPPERSGISDYSVELLPYLSKHYRVDLFINSEIKRDGFPLSDKFQVFPDDQLIERKNDYATVVYQFGNSPFHAKMYGCYPHFPGVVVMHDFYISQLINHIQLDRGDRNLIAEIDFSHGIKGLLDYSISFSDFTWDWPINWRLFKYAREIIAHSDYHKELLNKFFQHGWQPNVNIIPQLKAVGHKGEPSESRKIRKELQIPEDSFIFCSFGKLSENKNIELLISSFMKTYKSFENDALLYLAGDSSGGIYDQIINQSDKINCTGYLDPDDYHKYLQIADAAIQLRCQSRGETSRAILDCMALGIPVILNDHGTNQDFKTGVIKVPDLVSEEELADEMMKVQRGDYDLTEISTRAQQIIEQDHHPEVIADQYRQVIDRAIQHDERRVFSPAVSVLADKITHKELILNCAESAAKNLSIRKQTRILVDVSAINNVDYQTGIQRVVKCVLKEWLVNDSPTPFIEPVYISDQRIKRASRLTERILRLEEDALGSEVEIQVQSGDCILFLDTAWGIFSEYEQQIEKLKILGGKVVTVVYDLIPIRYPEFTDKHTPVVFRNWLNTAISTSDKIICISKTVANDLLQYIREQKFKPKPQLDVNYFILGANISDFSSQNSEIRDSVKILDKVAQTPLFLVVGTIEPRKGHARVLDAFDALWDKGEKFRLVFAGKTGWKVKRLVERIQTHSQLNKLFYFIESPTDAELNMMYSRTTALISASAAEGFGLPIIEAALNHVPAIVSDIPIFHEIGGDGVIYFSPDSTTDLIRAVREINSLQNEKKQEMIDKLKILTWKDSAKMLLDFIIGSGKNHSFFNYDRGKENGLENQKNPTRTHKDPL